jgi:hypothetical protein
MSESSLSLESRPAAATPTDAIDPNRNPTYPARVHINERAKLDDAMRDCDQRLSSALQKLKVLANHPQQALFVRLYQQMQGARDQAAEAVRRLPLEVGGLYHEDHERFEQAIQAIARLYRQWEKAGG